MVFFNYALRKLNAKIVYYGPGLCGKTTNLQWIHDHFEGGERGKMVSLATEGDRTIFFDLLPLEIGSDSRHGRDAPALYRARTGPLQLDPAVGPAGRRRRRLRGRFAARRCELERRESQQPRRRTSSCRESTSTDFPTALQFNKRDLRRSCAGRGTGRRSQPFQGADLRGCRHRRNRSPGDPRRHRQARHAEPQANATKVRRPGRSHRELRNRPAENRSHLRLRPPWRPDRLRRAPESTSGAGSAAEAAGRACAETARSRNQPAVPEKPAWVPPELPVMSNRRPLVSWSSPPTKGRRRRTFPRLSVRKSSATERRGPTSKTR